jgi:hypothetical protein
VLENGFVGNRSQRHQKLSQIVCAFPADTQKVRRGVEVKRRFRHPLNAGWQLGGSHGSLL